MKPRKYLYGSKSVVQKGSTRRVFLLNQSSNRIPIRFVIYVHVLRVESSGVFIVRFQRVVQPFCRQRIKLSGISISAVLTVQIHQPFLRANSKENRNLVETSGSKRFVLEARNHWTAAKRVNNRGIVSSLLHLASLDGIGFTSILKFD